jgi:hypothetical protein
VNLASDAKGLAESLASFAADEAGAGATLAGNRR